MASNHDEFLVDDRSSAVMDPICVQTDHGGPTAYWSIVSSNDSHARSV